MKRIPPVGKICWKKYDNFFSLWENHNKETTMFYMIGEKHHIYIGAIGINGGKQGLGTRYQKQYLNIAKAIFGKDEIVGQVAYAGTFKKTMKNDLHQNIMRQVEAYLQNKCARKYGREKVLFKITKINSQEEINIMLNHEGDVPEFLQNL